MREKRTCVTSTQLPHGPCRQNRKAHSCSLQQCSPLPCLWRGLGLGTTIHSIPDMLAAAACVLASWIPARKGFLMEQQAAETDTQDRPF